jgi:KAP family P-loop domain
MRKRLQSLGFSFTSDFDSLIGKFAAAQDYREKTGKSESHQLTRTTALAVVLFEAPEIQRALLSLGLSYEKFLAKAGLIDFSFSQGSQTDVDLFSSLDDAVIRYVRSDDRVLQTSKDVFAILILEDVLATPATYGELGKALRSCGLGFKRLSAALQSRSLPFDPRRPSLRIDSPARPTDSVSPPFGENKPSPGVDELPPQHVTEPAATTPFYSDHPAHRDLLNRKAVAETIATMIESVWREDDREKTNDRSFIVHLHGRWGSGKTSILNFLSESLHRNRIGDDLSTEAHSPAWVIVNYNAWRNQNLGPAWWTLMEAVYTQARDQFGGWRSAKGKTLIGRDRWWRIRSSHAPLALTTIAIVVIVLWLSWALKTDLFGKDGSSWFSGGLAAIASSIGIVVAIFTFGQTYRIGSARTAKSYLELSRDPLSPLIKRYGELIDDIGSPVAVFIDDLDRCNGEFVVELLQTIQTLFRNAKVLYVVAGDRDWICSSYQQQYAKFSDSLGEPGKSLGHLFVEKVFQLSVEVPRLGETERDAYWDQLINARQQAAPNITVVIFV